MAREIINKQIYVWHDLTADPTDTPKDDRYYFVVTKDDWDDFHYDPYFNYEACFCETYWKSSEYDETITYFKSYGMEPEDPYSEPEDFEHEVLAWVELVKEECDTFVPKLMEKASKTSE